MLAIAASPKPKQTEDNGTLSIGTRLGEFEIRGLVGIGGFGIVCRAIEQYAEEPNLRQGPWTDL